MFGIFFSGTLVGLVWMTPTLYSAQCSVNACGFCVESGQSQHHGAISFFPTPASLLSTAARRLLCVQSQEQLPQPYLLWKNLEKPSLRMHLKLRLMGNNQTMKNSHGHCVSWRTPSLSNPAKSFVAAKVSAKP